MSVQEKIKLPKHLKLDKDVRTQYGALCYRMVQGKPQILLVTSRDTRRWIIPKGWPMRRTSPAGAATIEAWEEGGVRGKVGTRCLGYFTYTKTGSNGTPDQPCVVYVFPIKVASLARDFPERLQRRRKWFSPKRASRKVNEPELQLLLKSFNPSRFR